MSEVVVKAREKIFNVLTDVLMRLAYASHGGWMAPILNRYQFPWYTRVEVGFLYVMEDERILRTPRWLRRRKTDTYLK